MVPHTYGGRSMLIFFLLAALLLAPRPAYGTWSAEPVQVHATTAACPRVAACGDGAYGAIVLWQEETGPATGVLRARRVLGNGDLDPAWPAPATVCATPADRSALGAVPDGVGGAYAWWVAGSSLHLTRLGPDGTLAAGWPAGGRVLGTLANPAARATVLADGSGGVYVAWLQPVVADMTVVAWLRLTHLGPDNTGVAGCPAGGRTIGYTDAQLEFVNTASIGLAPGGGVWAAWGTTVMDPGLGPQPGEWRLLRLLPNALAAPGWAPGGVAQGEFRGDRLFADGPRPVPDMTLVGVAGDGADGAYVVRGIPTEPYANGNPVLYRFGPDGGLAPGWPEQGIYVNGWAFDAFHGMPVDASFRALPDGRGGLWAGRPNVYDHGITYTFHRYTSAGTTSFGAGVGASIERLEVTGDGAGNVFVANCVPTGPYGPYDPYASVGARGGPAEASYSEFHPEILQTWYGDEGLAATEDGGAILAWSQVHERFGIFAVRLGAGGVVTDVPAAFGAVGPRFSLRYRPGVGIAASATFEVSGPVRCTLYDVTGRTVAAERFEVIAGAREWTIAGTRPLPPGLYFANLVGAGASRTTRVVVVR